MDKMNSFLKTHKLKRKKKALYLNRPTERKRVDEPINKNLLQNNPHVHMASRGKKIYQIRKGMRPALTKCSQSVKERALPKPHGDIKGEVQNMLPKHGHKSPFRRD